jgi:hypothetical protein
VINWVRRNLTRGDYLIIGTALVVAAVLATGWALGTIHFYWHRPPAQSGQHAPIQHFDD